MRRILAALVAALTSGGCALITGSTDGYTLSDSGSSALTICSSTASCDAELCCAMDPASTNLGICLPSCPAGAAPICDPGSDCAGAGLPDATTAASPDASLTIPDASTGAPNLSLGSD